MMNTELLLTFTMSVVVIVAVPGPSVMFIVGRALSAGRPAALAPAAGKTVGAMAQGAIVAFGLGSLVAGSGTAYNVMKTGGAAYRVLLGANTVRNREHSKSPDQSAHPGTGRQHLRQGFVVGITNPKSIVFLAAALPQFVDPVRGHVVTQILVLLIVYSLLCMVGDTSWGWRSFTEALRATTGPEPTLALERVRAGFP